jgi:glycosyltransferase involved in cell wall biosynthesis
MDNNQEKLSHITGPQHSENSSSTSKDAHQIRVLHVIARMNRGGTARYIARFMNSPELSDVNQLLALGHVQGAEQEDECVSALNHVYIPSLGRAINVKADLAAFGELQQVINEFHPDIIHSHTFKAGVIARLQKTTARKVHTFHGHLFDDNEFSSLKKIIIKYSEKYLARKTDLLVSVGTKVGDELRASGIGASRPWLSIPPGVDELNKIEKATARHALGLADDSRIIVGWMARVTGVKNPHLFLEVVRANPTITFAMAGQGDLSDEIARNKPHNLTIVGWADAATVWSAVDIAISTSDNEGMPIALIEAQLMGIPVVATDVGSSREVISDSETGFITRSDAGKLSGALQTLVNDDALRTKLGQQAHIRAKTYFDPHKMCQSHREMYLGLINGK